MILDGRGVGRDQSAGGQGTGGARRLGGISRLPYPPKKLIPGLSFSKSGGRQKIFPRVGGDERFLILEGKE